MNSKISSKPVLTLAFCAMFAALSCVLSPFTIPIAAIPIGFVHISIFMAAGLLGSKYGTLSQFVFVLIGAVGLPVFSNFEGGLGKIAGPTGGFIFGYILCAFVTGLLIERFGRSLIIMPLAMAAGIIATYLPGIIWFMYSLKASLATALMTCVVPFLIGDAVKIVLCSILVGRLYPIYVKITNKAIS